jgi:hypothetical protein
MNKKGSASMTKTDFIIKKVAMANNNRIPLEKAIKHYCFIMGANTTEKRQIAEFFGYSIKGA